MDKGTLKMMGYQVAAMQNQLGAMMSVIESELAKDEAPSEPEKKPAPEPRAVVERAYFGNPPGSPATPPTT